MDSHFLPARDKKFKDKKEKIYLGFWTQSVVLPIVNNISNKYKDTQVEPPMYINLSPKREFLRTPLSGSHLLSVSLYFVLFLLGRISTCEPLVGE